MRRAAFTLIELLAVIAIISILAALLFPVLNQAKEASKQSVCMSNLKQVALALAVYQNDFDGSYPMGGWQFPESSPVTSSRWYVDIEPYGASIATRNCPLNPFPIHNYFDERSDFGLNISISTWEAAVNESMLTSPSSLVLLTDAAQLDFTTLPNSPDAANPRAWAKWALNATGSQVEGPYIFFPGPDYPYAQKPDAYGDQYRRPYALHHGKVDIAFCDGHVGSQEIAALIGPMPRGYALTDRRNWWSNSR